MVETKAYQIVLIGILSATITGAKLALSFIPNIELVSFFLILFTIVFGVRKTLLISVIFTTTEIFIYGFGPWLMGYYIIWPTLVLITAFFSRYFKNEFHYAFLSGGFGLSFGFLFALYESLFYGLSYGLAYWIQGIGFDIIHMVSNYIIMILLYSPILQILMKLKKKVN